MSRVRRGARLASPRARASRAFFYSVVQYISITFFSKRVSWPFGIKRRRLFPCFESCRARSRTCGPPRHRRRVSERHRPDRECLIWKKRCVYTVESLVRLPAGEEISLTQFAGICKKPGRPRYSPLIYRWADRRSSREADYNEIAPYRAISCPKSSETVCVRRHPATKRKRKRFQTRND